MNGKFAALIDSLAPRCDELLDMRPVRISSLPDPTAIPKSGVYLFSEGDTHLYVGRSRRLRARLREHCNPKLLSAPFAFRIAREIVGKTTPSYTRMDSRRALVADAAFLRAFESATKRIRKMDIRYVAEDDAVRQALLEIYVSIVTDARYNDFKTT